MHDSEVTATLSEEDAGEGGFHEFRPGVFNNAAASKPANWNIPGKMLEKELARPAFEEKPAHLESRIHKELDAMSEANVRLQL